METRGCCGSFVRYIFGMAEGSGVIVSVASLLLDYNIHVSPTKTL